MNQGQQMFLGFILQRVKEDKKEEAREMLNEAFRRQEEGTFDKDFVRHFIPNMLKLIKDEFYDEVQDVMKKHNHVQ